MDGRELIRRSIAHQPTDRVGIVDSLWWETERDFHSEGMPENVSAEDYFDFDLGRISFDQSFRLPREVLEVDDGYRIVTDKWGTRFRELEDYQSTPGLIDFLVKDRQTWEEYKPLLAYDSSRVDWQAMEVHYHHLRSQGKYIALSMLNPFEATWPKIGPELQLMALVTDPEWVRDMYDADTCLIEDAFEDLWSHGFRPDGLWIWGDIAYNHDMLFSPKCYRDVLSPFHRRLCDLGHRHGCQIIYHSDGRLTHAIPLLLEDGIDCLQPLEVKADMDVLALKKEYGDQLALMGNIDARLYQRNDLEGLEQEIQTKVPAAMAGGGYIYHSDHSVPPGTKLATYCHGLDLVRHYGARANTV